MPENITLSAAVRQNLLSLKNASNLIDRTQNRLSSGLAIAKVTDDAVRFFQAKSLSDRAGDLSERKDAIDQGISALDAVLEATTALEDFVNQIKGIFQSAASQTKSQREAAGKQVQELVKQIQRLVDDSSYQGLNLINSSSATLTVRFSEKSDSKLEVKGTDFNIPKFFKNSAGANLATTLLASHGVATIVSKLGGFTATLSAYSLSQASVLAKFNSRVDLAINRLEQTISNIRSQSSVLATNTAILQVRFDFTEGYTNTLQTGSDKLTLADLNTEGANLVALQTRQQLGINALSFAGDAEQSILTLFR